MRHRVKNISMRKCSNVSMKKEINKYNRGSFVEFRQKELQKFAQFKNLCIEPNSSENLQNWIRVTTPVVGVVVDLEYL